MALKRLKKQFVHYSITGTRKMLVKNPRIKNAIKRVVHTQFGISLTSSTRYEKWLKKNFPVFVNLAQYGI